MSDATTSERLRRWRLILGGRDAEGTGASLDGVDLEIDRALASLYDAERGAGLQSSSPRVARWLGDIRRFFPRSVVRVLQRDALERLDLKRLLLEPELLEAVEPDVHLVSDLLALGSVLPERTRETARMVVRRVVEELRKRIEQPARQCIRGALNRASRTRRPRPSEIDWRRTILANLKHYQPEHGTIIPETLHGYGRQRPSLCNVILCVDQSGSMAASVVYAGVFAAVLASMPALRTDLVVFDTAVVDLSDKLGDPVDVLFGTQLGGGTDINRAVAYCESRVVSPTDTILVLITDLYEGGDEKELVARVARLVTSGVRVITLLALSDDGAPSHEEELAAALASLGVPSFACTPDLFPELMAAAIDRRDLGRWAAERGVVATRGASELEGSSILE
jgi:hypothetical protein